MLRLLVLLLLAYGVYALVARIWAAIRADLRGDADPLPPPPEAPPRWDVPRRDASPVRRPPTGSVEDAKFRDLD